MPPNEVRISGGTWFYKRIYPILITMFATLWFGVVVVSIWNELGPWIGAVAMLCAPGLVVAIIYREVQQAGLLKDVRLGANHLLVADSTGEVTIPLAAIEAVTQAKINNMRNRATVTLREPAAFGDLFTFMPRGAKRTPRFAPMPDDAVIVDLRARVDAARKHGGKASIAPAASSRSLMADAELDGPFPTSKDW